MVKVKLRAKHIGCALASVHFAMFMALALYIAHSNDPQSPMLWLAFAIIDFPVSLIYFLGGETYSSWLGTFGDSLFAQIFYLPCLIHGLFGTIWWYYLPRLFLPAKIGGVWGRQHGELD